MDNTESKYPNPVAEMMSKTADKLDDTNTEKSKEPMKQGLKHTEENLKTTKKRKKGNIFLTILMLLLAMLLALSLYFYFTEVSNSDKSSTLADQEITQIITEVSEHIILPENEKPNVATITDIKALKLQDPLFYEDAQNGDNVLVYTSKAVIYRSSESILVNVASISKDSM